MKLRYQLRGLGVGLIFAALAMMAKGSDAQAAMSDAQIMERARQLGMVESDSLYLSELQQTSAEAVSQEDIEQEAAGTGQEPVEQTTAGEEQESGAQRTEPAGQETSEQEATDTEQGTDGTEPTEQEVADTEQDSSDTEPEALDTSDTGSADREVIYSDDPVLFTIENGQSSYTVSKNLYAQGLVKDVENFDQYLIENGYSKSIRSGKYEIWPGTTEEELAKIITGKF